MISRSLRILRSSGFGFSQVSKKQLSHQHVQQSIDTILNEQQIEIERQRRQNQLQALHKELQKKVDEKIRLPLKLYGTKDAFATQFHYLPQRIMSYYRIHPSMITQHLMKIFKASLYAMVDGNQQFMKQYMEDGLRQKCFEAIKQARQKYTLSILEDKDFLATITQSCQIVDAVCVRGLTTDRDANRPKQQYKKFTEAAEVALITFTPLHLTYDSENFSNPTQNKKIYSGYENMVLRVLLRIRTPLRFNIKQIPISDEVYTWQHLIVMENQMVPPKHLQSKYKIETLMEWLGKYRFGMWKIADIDNFMKGNSLFRKHEGQDQFTDPIFQGTVFDKSAHTNIRKF